MISFWILPIYVALISAEVRHVHFECFSGGIAKIQYTLPGNDTVSDIFSTDFENNCSLSNNDFIGNGTKDSPYEITVNINPQQQSYKPCGAQIVNASLWKVEFAVKSFENLPWKWDTLDSLTCSFNMAQNRYSAIKSSMLPGKTYRNSITMMLEPGNSADIPNQLILGQKIKLKIKIPHDSDVKRARVTLCYVRDILHDNSTRTFYSDKCPVISYRVPMKFVTNKSSPGLIESTEFEAFRFNENGKIQITCYVEICTNATDLYCLNTDRCIPIGTFLHPYIKVKTPAYAVIEANTGVTNIMSSTLMPVTAILIFLTKSNWF